jgi:hypothetical protein
MSETPTAETQERLYPATWVALAAFLLIALILARPLLPI